MDDGLDPSWLTLAEASRRLGVSVDALRKRVRRGQTEARRGNDGLVRVLVAAGQGLADGQPAPGQGLGAVRPEGGQEPDTASLELALLREEVSELREALARAETGRDAAVALARVEVELRAARAEAELASARATVEREAARADRLEIALAEERRPWLAKVIEGLRRKPG